MKSRPMESVSPVVLSWPVEINVSKESPPYKDNIEHLEALEYLSRLRLGIAYLRQKRAGVVKKEDAEPVTEKAADLTSVRGRFTHHDLASGKVGLDELQDLLHAGQAEMKERTDKSLRDGVELHFEAFCNSYGLCGIERAILALMVADKTSESFRELYTLCGFGVDGRRGDTITTGSILSIVFLDYREQIIGRRYFSIEAPLIKNEILVPWFSSYSNTTNVADLHFDLHERVVRHVLGDRNIYGPDLQCISRVRSTVQWEQVILPENIKQDVLRLARSYTGSMARQDIHGLTQFFGYGTGLVYLFHGPSGTGKTMLANGLANHLNKDLMSVSFEKAAHFGASETEVIKYVFNEAKLSGGIVFFDECDDIFKPGNRESRALLIEIEKAECICILATNRPVELDPALDRRITMKVAFHLPAQEERERIWKALVPSGMRLSNEVSFRELARRYIFAGGQIKNTLLMAITNSAIKGLGTGAELTLEEIECAAENQALGISAGYPGKFVFKQERCIDDLDLNNHEKEQMRRISTAVREVEESGKGMRLVVGCQSLQTAIDWVSAIAHECDLRVEAFLLSFLLGEYTGSVEKVDPPTQGRPNLLHYALMRTIGRRAMKVFVDADQTLKEFLVSRNDSSDDNRGISSFLRAIADYEGILFIVTNSMKMTRFPVEVDYHLEIKVPPEEVQIRRWESYFKENGEQVDRLVDLVERHPLHLCEVDRIMDKARKRALLERGEVSVTIDDVYEIISTFGERAQIPVLFGRGSQEAQ